MNEEMKLLSSPAPSKEDGNVDDELAAMTSIAGSLARLSPDARTRVIRWAISRFEIDSDPRAAMNSGSIEKHDPPAPRSDSNPTTGSIANFEDFAEFFYAADPKTDVERALIGAAWAGREQAGFRAQEVNDLLKDLGYGIGNITDALNSLQARRPNEVMQVSKAGTSKQARKIYRVTRAGMAHVGRMLRGDRYEED